jgi:hypothetical protein
MANVTPYTSANDPKPYDPNATASSSSSTLPSNLADPTLSMYWTSAPDFAMDSSTSASGGQSQATPGTHSALSVQLGTLRAAENGLLGASSAIVDGYTSLKSLFEADKDWVFGQHATVTTMTNGGGYYDTWSQETKSDPIAATALQFANGDGTAANPGMNAVQEYALQVIGNVMGTVGEFIVAINNAGAAYAEADSKSVMPSSTSTA